MNESKICKQCKEDKPLTEYYKSKSKKNGKIYYGARCMTCCTVYYKKYYQAKEKPKFIKMPKVNWVSEEERRRLVSLTNQKKIELGRIGEYTPEHPDIINI